MSQQTSTLENLYQEELYRIPARVMVVIDKEWGEHSEDERTQLSKIINAIKLSPHAVQIIKKDKIVIEELAAFQPTRIISFGVPFQPEIKLYESTTLNTLTIIQADSVDKLDDARKKNLWLGLKNMFGI